MQGKNFKRLLLIILSVISVSCFTIGCSMANGSVNNTVQAQTIVINSVVPTGRIALNTELDIASTTTVEFNGTHTATNGVVVSPDDKIVPAGKIKFNQAGTYELRYFFDYQGVTHTAVQKVEVYSEYFNLSNANGGEIIVSDEENQLYCGKDGVIVNLKEGTTFVYNKILDLRDAGEDGLSNIIELDGRYGHFDEADKYVSDVLEGWVRLTDCYNPNIYIELRMQKSVNYNGCLFPGVQTNCQPVTGMDKGVTTVLGSSRIIKLDGIDYRVWQTDGSMNVGMYNMKTAMTTGAVWKYDMNTKRVYLSYNDGENFLVTDLDESLIYPNGNLFPGFTTGEVYVSVYASGYSSTYANTEIVSIGNDNLIDIVGEEYLDIVAPQVVVEKDKTTATGVYGAIGDTFVIPQARAIDVNIVGDIDVAVYRGYGSNTQTNVSVEDGKFVLSEKDLYTIVYTAKDKSGNVGKALFTVSTVATPDNRAITLNTLENSSVSAGEEIKNLYEVVNSINTAKDKVKVKVSIESANQNIVGEGAEFSFTPYYAGAYTVRYNYTDGVFEYEKVVNLTVENSSNVCFMQTFNAPKYYIKGHKYAIDDIKAYSFEKGYPETVQTSVYAVYSNGTEQQVDPTSITIGDASTVHFVYKASSGVSMATDEISIINADISKGYDMGKFFVGDFTANATSLFGGRKKDIEITSNVTSGNNTLSYFNAISPRNFALEYKLIKGAANFKSLKIKLTDVTNANNTLVLEIFNTEDGCYYSLNGGSSVKADLITFENTLTTVSYNYETKFLKLGTYTISTDFDASLVYLDIEMCNINGNAGIIVSKINNTSIYGTTYLDGIGPEIYVQDFQGHYAEGDIVKINMPEFSDVISGINYSTAKILVTCSDGKPVYDKNGNVVYELELGGEYEIVLDRIAEFYALYQVFDFAGKSSMVSVLLDCIDTTAPTIELNNISESKTIYVNAGDELTFKFKVSDNVNTAKDILVYIHLYCHDQFSYVPNVSNIKSVNAPTNGEYEETFTIKVGGRYTAQIHAIDEKGNVCIKYINIIAK